VLIVSTELEEVIALGDRVAVMFQGRIVDILDPAEATFERLGLLMGGAHPEDVQPEDAVGMAAAATAGGGTDG
jgi:simple sugar transport system ATP-binding protein